MSVDRHRRQLPAGSSTRDHIVALLRARDGNVTQTTLARALHLDRSTVSYHIARLVCAGIVRREEPEGSVRWQRYRYRVVR